MPQFDFSSKRIYNIYRIPKNSFDDNESFIFPDDARGFICKADEGEFGYFFYRSNLLHINDFKLVRTSVIKRFAKLSTGYMLETENTLYYFIGSKKDFKKV